MALIKAISASLGRWHLSALYLETLLIGSVYCICHDAAYSRASSIWADLNFACLIICHMNSHMHCKYSVPHVPVSLCVSYAYTTVTAPSVKNLDVS